MDLRTKKRLNQFLVILAIAAALMILPRSFGTFLNSFIRVAFFAGIIWFLFNMFGRGGPWSKGGPMHRGGRGHQQSRYSDRR